MATNYHGKDFVLTIGGTAMNTGTNTCSISMDRDTAEVTVAADSAKTFVGGDYTCGWSIGGPCDFTDTTGTDEVLFGYFDGGADAWVFMADDGGVGATNPSYTQNAILTNYTISAGVGDAVTWTASAQGTSTVVRAEA